MNKLTEDKNIFERFDDVDARLVQVKEEQKKASQQLSELVDMLNVVRNDLSQVIEKVSK